ncbi:MAG: hypothetical protein ACRCW0_00360 [Clostridium sp.]
MKKKIGLGILLLIVVLTFTFVNINKQDYGVSGNDANVNLELKFKGLKGARDFVKDEKENFYIAFKGEIIVIEEDGKSYNLISDKNFDITSMDYRDKILYFASNSSVYSYNVEKKELKECIKGIPNVGDYNDIHLKLKDEYLFVSIGSVTNSGVVGDDNQWTKQFPTERDHTPYKITLNGINYGSDKTGGFRQKGQESFEGQIIEDEQIGNSTVLIYNLKSGAYETFAWGIRNITGLDFTSTEKLYAAVGGMESRGERAIYNDKDYVYEIKKTLWYGFPDFSGGDPVTSPKFMDKNQKTQNFLLNSHPNPMPQGPIYEHDKVSAIKALSVDSKGILGSKDDIYFYDDIDKIIYVCGEEKAAKEFVKLGNKSNIKSIRFTDEGLQLLEEAQGNIYTVSVNELQEKHINFKEIFTYIIAVLLTAIMVTTFFFLN